MSDPAPYRAPRGRVEAPDILAVGVAFLDHVFAVEGPPVGGGKQLARAQATVGGGASRRRGPAPGFRRGGARRPGMRLAPAMPSTALSHWRLSKGMPVDGACTFANAAAALKCTRFGGIAGAPTRAEVDALLAKAGDMA